MAMKDTTITSIDDEPKAVVLPKTVKVLVTDDGDNMTGERAIVTVQQGEGELGRQAVFLGINGHGYNIPRGVPVELPVEALAVLENAMQTTYENIEGKMTEREVPRYGMTVKYKK